MKDRLRNRLPKATDAEIDVMADIVEQYELHLTVKNLDAAGLVLHDLDGRTVRISFGTWRNGLVHIKPPESDIAIVVVDGIVGGWVNSDKLSHVTDRSIVDLKFLAKMPTEFRFIQECSHLEDHGGIYEGEFWECLGCGRTLIFNDK